MPALGVTLNAVSTLFGFNYGAQAQALDTLLGKISRETRPAAEKLSDALSEIDNMLTVLDGQLVRYLQIAFDDNKISRADKSTLLELESGQARVRIEEGRGHCAKIRFIYDVHLKRWLADTLDPQQAQALEVSFNSMENADLEIMMAADNVNTFLMAHAEATLNAVEALNFIEAADLVRDARAMSLPYRRSIFEELAILRRYENAFLQAAKVV